MDVKTNQIDPTCTRCNLHNNARRVCMNGQPTKRTPLMVFSDNPDYLSDSTGVPYAQDTGRILNWMFERMSIDPKIIVYDYVLRCWPGQLLPSTNAGRSTCIYECADYRFDRIAICKPRIIVTLGQVALQAFTGKTKVGDWNQQPVVPLEGVVRDWVKYIFPTYSLQYILRFPSDTPSVFRTIFAAAAEAGLDPKIDSKVKPFKWSL